MSEKRVSENMTRFSERSNVCPSDNEPVVRSVSVKSPQTYVKYVGISPGSKIKGAWG